MWTAGATARRPASAGRARPVPPSLADTDGQLRLIDDALIDTGTSATDRLEAAVLAGSGVAA